MNHLIFGVTVATAVFGIAGAILAFLYALVSGLWWLNARRHGGVYLLMATFCFVALLCAFGHALP